MGDLFVRPNGTPMQFHLADLDEDQERNYTFLIEDRGGKVEKTANEKVLTFTTKSESLRFNYAFDVKFIDDCTVQRKILNVESYFLGDPRRKPYCPKSRIVTNNSQCFIKNIGCESICKFEKREKMKICTCPKDTVLEKDNNYHDKTKRVPALKKNTAAINIAGTEITTGIDEIPNSTVKISPISREEESKATEILKEVACSKISGPSEPSTSKDIKNVESIASSSENGEEELQKQIENITDNLKKDKTRFPSVSEVVLTNTKKKSTQSEIANQKSVSKVDKNKGLDTDENGVIASSSEDESIVSRVAVKRSQAKKKIEEFVRKTVDGKSIDKDGNPCTFTSNFEPWETKAMIEYLLVSDKVSEAKDIYTWRDAQKLKFLPKKRAATAMQNHFKRVILPNIESYYLSPEDLNKFRALGIPKKVLE